MALNEVVSLIRIKADTSQAKAEIRSLRGVEKQAATERLAEMEGTNRGIDKQIATLGKVTLVLGAGVAAFKLAQAAANSYMEDLRLESAAAGVNIDALRKSTIGLIETDDLLRFAGKAQAGVWKLNQKEMETVLKGATALRKTMGVELKPTIDALTDAVAKGSTRALKEFGIEAKDKAGALKELDKIFASIGGNAGMAGDEMQQAGVSIADAMDNAAGKMGEAVLKLAPLVSGFAALVSALGDFINLVGDLPDWLVPDGSDGGKVSKRQQRSSQAQIYRSQAAKLRSQAAIPDWHAQRQKNDPYFNGMVNLFDGSNPMVSQEMLNKAAGLEASADALVMKDVVGTSKATIAMITRAMAEAQAKNAKDVAGNIRRGGGKIDVLDLSGFGDSAGDSMLDDLKAGWAAERAPKGPSAFDTQVASIQGAKIAGDAQRSKQDGERRTYLETVFGTPAEIEAMTASLKLAADVFEGFSGAVVAGFDAWITGQKSIAAAFNEAIAEMIRGLAKQMAMEAIKHTAFGFGSLAFGPIGGVSAAAHFKAAGLFAAGAAVAGAAAKGMGQATGQWSQGGSAGSSSPARTIGNGPSSSEGNAPITIYVGAEWAAMSKIEQAAGIQRAIRLGKRGSRHVRH